MLLIFVTFCDFTDFFILLDITHRKVFKTSLVCFVVLLGLVSGIQAGVEFTCVYSEITLAVIGNVYMCQAEVNITSESRRLEKVEGNHLSKMKNSDVEFLAVYGQDLPFIPEKIDSFFKNLKGLEWRDSNLASISYKDLDQFGSSLLVFLAPLNKLVTIDGDLFKKTKKLLWISFNGNEIQHVGKDLVKDVKNLEHLYFYSNPCVDDAATNKNDVSRLNDELPIVCPADGTTTISASTLTSTTISTTTGSSQADCPSACSMRIDSSEEGISRLNYQIIEQRTINEEQAIKIDELSESNDRLEERLLELERRVRELSSNPRAP